MMGTAKHQPIVFGGLYEALFFLEMRKYTLLDIMRTHCAEFQRRYKQRPDVIFANEKLIPRFEIEVAAQQVEVLPVSYEDVIWFYCPQSQAEVLPSAEWLIISSSRLSGACVTV